MQYEMKKQFNESPLACPVRVEYDFFFKVPDSISKKKKEQMILGSILHTKKVDVTNLIKFTEDCLKGVVIVDDSQVVELSGRKKYSEKNSIIIKIYPITEDI